MVDTQRVQRAKARLDLLSGHLASTVAREDASARHVCVLDQGYAVALPETPVPVGAGDFVVYRRELTQRPAFHLCALADELLLLRSFQKRKLPDGAHDRLRSAGRARVHAAR